MMPSKTAQCFSSTTRQRVAACLGVALLLLVSPLVEAAEPKRVLLLQSFGNGFAPFTEFAARFRQKLSEKWHEPIDMYETSLDIARFSVPRDDAPFVTYLSTLFAERRPDLIVAVGGPGARFIQQNRSRLFPDTPMLITATDQRLVDMAGMTANDTAVAVNLDQGALIDNILRVLPETTEVAVVSGNSSIEQYWVAEERKEFQPFADRIKFIWLNDIPYEQMLTRVAALPPRSAILYGLFDVDADGVPHEGDRALDDLHIRASAPIFGFVDSQFGRGIVGGPLLSIAALSERAAEVAVAIFRGAKPSDIKTVPARSETPIFDWRELQRWGVSEAHLPAGSIVKFREPSIWTRYRWPITLFVLALLVQGAIITWLLVERYRRLRAEDESRSRLLETIHLNRTAAAGALSASVAHELNQPLGAILSNTEAAELLLNKNPPDLDQVREILIDIRQADQRAADIIRHLRKLLKRRSEIELHKFDLNDTIADAVHILSPEAKKRGVALHANGIRQSLPVRADQIHLQQVILNLATNGMDAMTESTRNKHEMTIQTALTGGQEVEVSVADSGTGIPNGKLEGVFDSFYTTKKHGTGLGLSIARTIVETYGGKIWAENRSGGGAVVRFTLPLADPHPI
jgi:signal transduction histidine kinase